MRSDEKFVVFKMAGSKKAQNARHMKVEPYNIIFCCKSDRRHVFLQLGEF